jgi:hypothetical protein
MSFPLPEGDMDDPLIPATFEGYKPSPILKYFNYDHIPLKLQPIVKPITALAHEMDKCLIAGPEKEMGLRKLRGEGLLYSCHEIEVKWSHSRSDDRAYGEPMTSD